MEDILAEWHTAWNLTRCRVTWGLVCFQAFCKGLTIMISRLVVLHNFHYNSLALTDTYFKRLKIEMCRYEKIGPVSVSAEELYSANSALQYSELYSVKKKTTKNTHSPPNRARVLCFKMFIFLMCFPHYWIVAMFPMENKTNFMSYFYFSFLLFPYEMTIVFLWANYCFLVYGMNSFVLFCSCVATVS